MDFDYLTVYANYISVMVLSDVTNTSTCKLLMEHGFVSLKDKICLDSVCGVFRCAQWSSSIFWLVLVQVHELVQVHGKKQQKDPPGEINLPDPTRTHT